MKKTFLAVCTITALSMTLVSCDRFSKKSKIIRPAIVGKWKVDSAFASGKDSTKHSFFIASFLNKENDSAMLQFNADSTYSKFDSVNKVAKRYYVQGEQIFIQEDSSYSSFALAFPRDSIAKFTTDDSLVLILKRK